jgi:glycosyltransferase involved in cell wall biosynthesis
MPISVIVPTRNEMGNVPHLLASLPAGLELVVCDASTDETPSLVADLRPENTVILASPGTIAQARQQGARASSGQILVFSDADVEFDSGYFDRLLTRTDWDGICGAKLSRGAFARDYQLMLRAQRFTYHQFGIAAASGSNMAVTRDALERLGGFRCELSCNEDTELFLRASRRGLRVRFDAGLVVWARDHRRLRKGRTTKVVHSLVRNILLYVTCCRPRLPHWLEGDWGYWAAPGEQERRACMVHE